MTSDDKVNILLVDDQPSKLLTYEVILRELGENLIKASSGTEALEHLLKNEIAVILMDVSMPELDGFQLGSMIREHPRFQKIAMIFVSAIHLAEIDHLRGYEMGAMLEHGQPHQAEFRVRRPNGDVRWCASTAAATRDGKGNVVRISGVTMDITERKDAEERQALLAREVDHRAKNAMAIVQSIVRLTKADSIAEYASVIEGRIKALSRAHALLSDSRWQGAEMAKLVEEELAPYRSGHADRIRISGPKVVLEPTTAQTLALALHELSTNAVKYGSLSQAAGRLELDWELQPAEIVATWRDSGGPAVQPPRQTGFGAKIITSS